MEQKLTTKPSLTLTRSYPVSPEKVWRAWTDPEAVKKWWGPGPGEPAIKELLAFYPDKVDSISTSHE